MADTKITALAAITTVDPAADVLPIVDVSDTSMAASGTTKKITSNQILGAGGTATLASATITGDLTVDTSTLKVDSANNRLGIGIATPNRNAVIYATASPVLQICDATTGTTANDGLLITQAGVDTFIENAEIGGMNFRTSAVTRYQIDSTGISTWSVGGSTAMTLNSTGLGVGVSPSFNIHARGTTDGRIQVEGASGYGMVFVQASSGNTAQIQLNSNGGSGRRYLVGSNSSGEFLISDETAAQTRLLLDSSGNVGVSTTPKAWSSGAKALQILSFLSAWQGSNGSANLGFGVYEGGANTYNYSTTGDAPTFYSQLTGAHRWYTAPSGTAGNAITFSQVMTLDANGNLILKSSNTPATLANNGELTVNATSNTNLRFSYRGSDGVTRVANITLA